MTIAKATANTAPILKICGMTRVGDALHAVRNPELQVVAGDEDRIERLESAVAHRGAPEDASVRQYHGARVREPAVGPAEDGVEQVSVGLVVHR